MAFNLEDPPQVLLLHIGWALEYQGDPDDLPQGKFGYIKAVGNEDLGEALNFKPFRGNCYGYAPLKTINLAKLGGTTDDDFVDNVLVIWTATNPDGTGRFIVGWYKSARVFDSRQQENPGFIAKAPSKQCFVVPKDKRTFYIPHQKTGWPGIASAYFASSNWPLDRIQKILTYVDGTPSDGFLSVENPSPGGAGGGWPKKPNLEQNEKIEKAAEKVVEAYYTSQGWTVKPVQDEWFGWDMTMSKGARQLFVEVKGRGQSGPVEISANEYRRMNDPNYRMKYRLAIVFHALTLPKLTIFSFLPSIQAWVSDAGDTLTFKTTGVSASF